MSSPSGKQKVLILHAAYHVGGAERILQQLALQLRAHFDVEVCALYQPGAVGEEMAHHGLSVHALQGASRADLGILPRFLRLLKQLHPDVILTVDAPLSIAYALIARRLRLTQKLVVAVHSFGKFKRTREMAVARWLASGRVDVLVALSETHRQFLLECEGWQAPQVVVIPNGVDLQRFTPAGANLREAWGLLPNIPAFGIVAGLRPEKNPFRFLRVADRVLAEVPQAKAFVVGDGELRNELEALSRNLPGGARMVFTGALKDIPAVWRTLDVATLTSDTEVLPMALIEAGACGVPAVSTEVGAVRDVIVHGETGFLAPCQDEEAMALHIVYLLRHPEERARMGTLARQHVQAHFDLHRMIESYVGVLSLEAQR